MASDNMQKAIDLDRPSSSGHHETPCVFVMHGPVSHWRRALASRVTPQAVEEGNRQSANCGPPMVEILTKQIPQKDRQEAARTVGHRDIHPRQ